MDNPNNEMSVGSNTFYPERIIFCIDISGEMNQKLEFNDLPYPSFNNVVSEFQTQKLSVPNSPNESPVNSPPLPPRGNSSQEININNFDQINLYPDINDNNINTTINTNGNSMYNYNDGFSLSNYATNNYDTASYDNNMIYNMDNYNGSNEKSSNNIKSFAQAAKKLIKKKGDKDDLGSLTDNSRSSSPNKNMLNNNNNSNSSTPELGMRKSSSSLNFLKSGYSNVVQNVFNNNHSRASSNTSTGSLTNAPVNSKDFPALKQPIELTRLEAVKRYIKRFVSLKGSLCREHQYALVLLGVDAIWFSDFTSDYKNIINISEEIPAQDEYIQTFDMDSLLNLLKEKDLIPNVLTSSHLLRIIFLYSRPVAPAIDINNPILKQLQESKLFMFDCVYFHEKKSDTFNPQTVFNELLKMEDPSNPSLFFDVIRNGQKFSIAMMKLLGHPLQRTIK